MHIQTRRGSVYMLWSRGALPSAWCISCHSTNTHTCSKCTCAPRLPTCTNYIYTCVRVIPPNHIDATSCTRCPSIKIRSIQQNTNKDGQKVLMGPRGWKWRCEKREKTGRLTCFTSAGMLQIPPFIPKKWIFLQISGRNNGFLRSEKFSRPFSPPRVSSRPPGLFALSFSPQSSEAAADAAPQPPLTASSPTH